VRLVIDIDLDAPRMLRAKNEEVPGPAVQAELYRVFRECYYAFERGETEFTAHSHRTEHPIFEGRMTVCP